MPTDLPSGTFAGVRARHWMGLALLVVVDVFVRWPGYTMGGFASHDVAGILYNAMLLHDGGLPYLDSVELKAPGTFYLASVLAAPGGTNIAAFQVAANLCGLASLLGVSWIAFRTWGPTSALLAGALYALHGGHLDSLDANYVTWPQPLQIAAMGLVWGATRRESTARGRAATWLGAGALAGAAALCKRPAAMAFIAIVVWIWVDPRGPDRRERTRRTGLVVAGTASVHLPIALHYAALGELSSLWDGYVMNRWGLHYVLSGSGESVGWGAAWEGLAASVYFLALPLALALFAAARRSDRVVAWLVTWAVAMLIATVPGLRFYKGYFLGALPALCLLAAAPWGVLDLRRAGAVLAWCVCAVLATRQGALLTTSRLHRFIPHDDGARQVTDHLRQQGVEPGMPVWVWGWHLWDVYPMLESRSASRIYKSLGLLTPPNDDTWRRGPSRARFVAGPAADLLLEDLQRTPPAYIVLGSTVPHRQFKRLRRFLFAHYIRDRRLKLGRVEFWRSREMGPVPPAKPADAP